MIDHLLESREFMITTISDEEILAAAAILAKLQPGYLPEPLFDQITRLHVTSTVVLALLRITDSATPEILLIRRGTGPNEPIWPGHWHLPGTMLRPTDAEGGYDDAFKRLLSETGELAGTALKHGTAFVRTAFTKTKRGPELTQVFVAEIKGEPKAGKFFPVDKLPRPIIEHELAYIQEATAKLLS